MSGTYELHPKVAMGGIAGALTNIAVGVLAQAGIADLTAYQAELIVILSAVVGYMTPSD